MKPFAFLPLAVTTVAAVAAALLGIHAADEAAAPSVTSYFAHSYAVPEALTVTRSSIDEDSVAFSREEIIRYWSQPNRFLASGRPFTLDLVRAVSPGLVSNARPFDYDAIWLVVIHNLEEVAHGPACAPSECPPDMPFHTDRYFFLSADTGEFIFGTGARID